MRLGDVLDAMRRRWYLVVVVAVAFAAVGWVFASGSGTYYSKTDVWFTLNSAPTILPDNGVDNPNVIAFAGAIATELNRGRPPAKYSSPDAPYYGAGVRQGVLVGLRDGGGTQWSSWFQAAVIELQVVGRTHEWVEREQGALLARINAEVRERDGGDGLPNSVTVTIEPLTQSIEYIGASRISRVEAYSALVFAAVLASGLACLALDPILLRMARSRVSRRASRTMKSEVSRS